MSDWFFQLDSAGAIYLALFVMLMGGAVGLPIPEDIPLILGGVAIHHGSIESGWALFDCYLGVVLGDIVVFFIGWRFGPALFERPWFKSKFPPRKVRGVRRSVEKRSLLMIFIARHLFYLRTATFLTCGAVKMSPIRFILSDATAALVSVPLFMWMGYKFTEQIESAFQLVDQAKIWSFVIVALVLIIYLFFRLRRGTTENGLNEL